MRALVILCFLFLVACSPQKRHARLVKKHPEVHKDIVTIKHDTIKVITDSVIVDTAFEFLTLKDTVTIFKDKLKVKMYAINDTIYMSAECKTDTIEKIIEIRETITHSPIQKKVNYFWYFLGALIIILMLIIKILK